LTVDGKAYTQPLTIVQDPRVSEGAAALAEQTALARKLASAMDRSYALMQRAQARNDKPSADRYEALNRSLGRLYGILEGADAEPTVTVRDAATKLLSAIAHDGRTSLEIPEGDEP
jgi:hypothetical protein